MKDYENQETKTDEAETGAVLQPTPPVHGGAEEGTHGNQESRPVLLVSDDGLAIQLLDESAGGEKRKFAHNPAHTIGTCAECGEEMTYNIPRLGKDGGFIHQATGKFECSLQVAPPASPKLSTGVEEKVDSVCDWLLDDEAWKTDCGQVFVFNDDGPQENGFKFCPYCGNRLEQSIMEDREDE